jgi:hypothetical protein
MRSGRSLLPQIRSLRPMSQFCEVYVALAKTANGRRAKSDQPVWLARRQRKATASAVLDPVGRAPSLRQDIDRARRDERDS